MVEYDPYAYEMHDDPYPTYAALRAEAPVYRNERLGFWALSRHADVLAGFRDVARFSNKHGVSLDPASSHPQAHLMMSFLAMDAPRHTRMRALVSRGFTPRRIADLEPRIREIARRHIDGFIADGRCDFIRDFAGKLPMDVISDMLGVPPADRDQLRAWADTVVHREEGVTDVPRAGQEAAMHLIGYFGELVAEHRARPRDDLTAALLAAEIDGDRLADAEVLGFLFLMIIAGNETTTKLLGNAVYWLWRNPEQRRRLGGDPDLIPRWIEETLRYDGSTQALARTIVGDVELHGRRLRDGDRVVLLVGSANRDERVFPEPDRYDLDRDTSDMLSFGHGTHFCLGAALARLEARVALQEVERRFPDFAIDPAGIARVHSVNVRGFAALPMTFTPGAPSA
jgi:cytochrome P450